MFRFTDDCEEGDGVLTDKSRRRSLAAIQAVPARCSFLCQHEAFSFIFVNYPLCNRQLALEAEQAAAQQRVAIEPDPGEGVLAIQFRVPTGARLSRRFYQDSPVRHVLDFVHAAGFTSQGYSVFTAQPRRELGVGNQSVSLISLGLSKREVLIVEERM